jgi:hypothetical protein
LKLVWLVIHGFVPNHEMHAEHVDLEEPSVSSWAVVYTCSRELCVMFLSRDLQNVTALDPAWTVEEAEIEHHHSSPTPRLIFNSVSHF